MPRGIYIRTKKRNWKIKDTSKMKGHSHGFKKGQPAWNKGLSIKLNDGLAKWRDAGGQSWNKGLFGDKNPSTGRKVSEEGRRRMSDVAKQKVKDGRCNLWRGGIREKNSTERRIIMDSFEYRMWRKNIFERDDYSCQECGVRGGTLQADHIKPFAEFPDSRFELSNGRTLCVACHRKTKTYGVNKKYIRSVN